MAKGSFVLRATVGGIMLGHGLQKLQGAFGGPGLEGTEKFLKSLDMHPAKYHARAVALSETAGGALTAAGLFSPLGPAMVIGTMAVAVQKVHLKKGFFLSQGGYEFNLLLMSAAFTLATQGPGLFSLDALLRKRRSGLRYGLLALGIGLGAAAATLKVAETMGAEAEADSHAGAGTQTGTDGTGTDGTGTGGTGTGGTTAESTESTPLILDDES